MELQGIKKRFETSVQKQHDYRHLPRTRCKVLLPSGVWVEFILPPGEEAAAFCRGEKTLNPKAHQIKFPGTQPELQEVIVNFDTGKAIMVIPEPAPGG